MTQNGLLEFAYKVSPENVGLLYNTILDKLLELDEITPHVYEK